MKLLQILEFIEQEPKEQSGLLKVLNTGVKGGLKAQSKEIIKSFDDVISFALQKGQKGFYDEFGTLIKNSDDLYKNAVAGTLKGGNEAAGQLVSGLLKSGSLPPNLVGDFAKSIVVTKKFKNLAKTGTASEIKKALKEKGYTEEAVNAMVKEARSLKLFGSKTAANTVKNTVKNTGKGINKTTLLNKVKEGVKKVPIVGPTLTFVKNRLVGGLLTKGVFNLLLLGGAGWMGYKFVMSYLEGDAIPDNVEEPSDDDLKKTTDWLNCIVNPLKDDTNLGEIGELDNGQLYIDYNIESFGGIETGGSVRFFNNYTIKTKSGKTGKWTCNQSSVKSLQEQEDPQLQMDNDVEQMIDLLDFPVSGSDLQSAHGLLKKYKNSGDGQTFLSLYQRTGYGDGDLRKTLKFVTTTKATSTRLKDEMLGMISSIEGGGKSNAEGNKSDKNSKGGDGNPNTGLSHLTVTWDEKGGGKKGGGTKFSPCSDFPFKLGCISDKIKDIQRCINPTANLKVDGYFGPLTLKAMQDQSKFADTNPNDDIITKEVYDNVMKVCNKKETVKPVTTDTTTREKVKPIEGLKMIDIKPVNSKSLIDKYGVENLIKQRNKRVDGEIVANIIKDKIEFVGGRYKLKMDSELTEDQLKTINLYMAGKGFELLRKKEGLDKSKYVWATDDKTKKRAARKEKAADKKIDKIGNNE